MAPRHGEPVFVISVAARLLEMHPQTLRKYEREGLIAPSRTTGNLRLYSDRDIERLRQVKYLVDELGLNLAGVQLALELTRRLRDVHSRVEGQDSLRCDLDAVLGLLGIHDERGSSGRIG
ncbi:MAG: heat shock protein transcriptional repressor HspR [Thermomicrobiales bacterium]